MERTERLVRGALAVVAAGVLVAGVGVVADAVATWWVALILLAVGGVLTLLLRRLRRWLPRRLVLEVDLDQAPVEVVPDSPFGLAAGSRPVLREVVDALTAAAADDRVRAVLVRVGTSQVGLARAQELHDALAAVRRSGTRTVAFAETFGEGGNGTADYLVAAACDEVALQPGGEFGVVGVASRSPFLRDALDRLSLRPQFDHRRQYKATMYRLTERSMPTPDREATQALVSEALDHVVAGIAAGRDLDAASVRQAIDDGPLAPTEARDRGFVDRLAYRDEVRAEAERDRAQRLDLATYAQRRPGAGRRSRTIAVIYATGAVQRGRSRPDVLSRGTSMGADDVVEAIETAADQPAAAIVVRVDSPGGSAVASETIWRAVARAREHGLPVVASFGDVAASGGYYLACGADRIVAQPTTITGSIGVVGGKLVTGDAWQRLGVAWSHVTSGAHATMYAADLPFDPAQWERFQAYLDDVYALFKQRVADGRGLDLEAVEAIAKGRVWIGTAAAERGLVDELGGLKRAVDVARELAGLPADAPVRLRVFPERSRLPWRRLAAQRRQAAAALDSVARIGADTGAAVGAVAPPGVLWWDGQLRP